MRGTSHRAGIWRLSLEQIEATVADHLGHGRVLGNQRGPCFSRQISMYLAKNVGGWTSALTKNGPALFTKPDPATRLRRG